MKGEARDLPNQTLAAAAHAMEPLGPPKESCLLQKSARAPASPSDEAGGRADQRFECWKRLHQRGNGLND